MSFTAGDGSGEARLLVVEDEETILELLAGSLRFAGFEVRTAASGAEALRAVAASRPDLMLLDVMMPDGDGFEVVRRMRLSGPDVPVIFLIARDGHRLRGRGTPAPGHRKPARQRHAAHPAAVAGHRVRDQYHRNRGDYRC